MITSSGFFGAWTDLSIGQGNDVLSSLAKSGLFRGLWCLEGALKC